jgi:hypothetical protein
VVDATYDYDPNDEGAMWRPGESFEDPVSGIIGTVVWADTSGSILTLTNAGRADTYVNGAMSGYEDGSPSHPWNTVLEGHGGVFSEGDVYIAPGFYDETLRLVKPAVLARWGSSGSVIIGE